MEKITKEDLINLYNSTKSEEQFFLDEHQKRVTFFTGILSTLIGITIYGYIMLTSNSNPSYLPSQLYFLSIIPFMIILVSIIGVKSANRFYRRFLESITVMAKIQQELNLIYPRRYPSKADLKLNGKAAWYYSEPFVPTRHLKSRKKINSDEEFIESHLKKGYNRWVFILFIAFAILGCILFALILSKILQFIT